MPSIQNHFSTLHFSAHHLLPQTWAAWVALNLNLCLSSHKTLVSYWSASQHLAICCLQICVCVCVCVCVCTYISKQMVATVLLLS